MGAEDVLHQRLQKLTAALLAGSEPPSSLVVATGQPAEDDDIGYLKSYAVFAWLFGAELQNTALFFSKSHIIVLTTDGAAATDLAKITPPAAGRLDGKPAVTVKKVDRDAGPEIKKALEELSGSGPRRALLTKEMNSTDIHTGPFFKALRQEVSATAKDGADDINAAELLAKSMAIKDEIEENRVKRAAAVTTGVFRNFLIPKLEEILDREQKVPHSKLSAMADDAIIDPTKSKIKGVKADSLDSCYAPIIQSGGTYDLKPSAISDDRNLQAGCVIVSLGARYSLYCSSASRTFLVDASAAQRDSYDALVAAYEKGLESMKPGAQLKSCYAAVATSLDSKGLKSHLAKNVGFLTGIEYREGSYIINAKSTKEFEGGMIFHFCVGLQNLKDQDNGVYALMVADTVSIPMLDENATKPAEVLTGHIRKSYKSISYRVSADDEEDEKNDDEVVEIPEPGPRMTRTDKAKGSRTRGDVVDVDAEPGGRRRRDTATAAQPAVSLEEIEERNRKQEELARKLCADGLAKLRGGGTGAPKEKQKEVGIDEHVAYKSTEKYPSGVRPRQLFVDMDREVLLVPINGMPVPFHIAMVKSVTKSDEGSLTYLRINFHVPATIGGTRFGGNKKDGPKFPDSKADFIKELSFRSSNASNLNDVLRQVSELRKRFSARQQAKAEAETMVEQPSLVLDKGKVPLLSGVSMRPPIATSKYNTGQLESHSNGFRYRGVRGGAVDIMYSNIKNAFFQEAKGEVIVIIHFHLRHPIVVGKKKTQHVQFYTEVMEAAVKLNDTRRRRYDHDELEEEQREREMRNRLNKLFLRFTKDVEERHQLEFEVPYRQLGFTGAPENSSVLLVPTVSCIISLVEWPPFVLNLEEVAVAVFERVSFHLKNFDLVFVFKHFDEGAPKSKNDVQWLRIGAIPSKDLEGLKKYLNEQQIKFYENPKNLNWTNILSTIRGDLETFYEDGAWASFLGDDNDEEGGEDDEGEDDEDEVFEVSEEELDDAVSSESEDSEYAGDDDDEDALDELEGDSDAGEEDLESDDEGKDWDELEAEAALDDRRKGHDSDEERRTKSKGSRPKKRSRDTR